MTDTIIGFEDATALLEEPRALRQSADENGYLFFKGLLPREPLLELRKQITDILQERGWLKAGVDPLEGIVDHEAIARTCRLDESMRHLGVTNDAYRQVQHLERFHRLPHHPKLIALYETLFGADVLPHPRHIARVLMPSPDLAATPPHQDYTHIQGTHGFWTCWFPLGDCPVELGGLSVLRGSNREGILPVAAARGAGGKESILCDKTYSWVGGDYACGDVITFPSHTVHRGLPNQLGDRVRISLDLRYQRADEDVEERSLRPHLDIATWDEIYQHWTQDDLKYYWRHRSLKTTTFDEQLVATREKIC